MEEPRRRLNLLWEISSSTLAIGKDDQRTLKERKRTREKDGKKRPPRESANILRSPVGSRGRGIRSQALKP
jgi:hypothetical protein